MGTSQYPLELMVSERLRAFDLNGWITVSDAESYVACALRGAGLIQLPRSHNEDELEAGTLIEVLQDCPSPPLDVSALYSYRRQLSPRVREFVDWLCEWYAERFENGRMD